MPASFPRKLAASYIVCVCVRAIQEPRSTGGTVKEGDGRLTTPEDARTQNGVKACEYVEANEEWAIKRITK